MDRNSFRTNPEKNSIENIKAQIDRREHLRSYGGPGRVIPWNDYLTNHEQGKAVSLSSGYIELDSLVEGFQTEELITVSGNTGQGKTLWVKSLIRSFANQKVPVTVFSFEDPATRFLAAYKDLPECETIYVPDELTSGSLDWLEERALEAKVKYDSKIIVIDHLHYVVDMSVNRNFSLNIGAAMRFIKEKIAIGLNQIVFLVCHQEKINDEIEPSLSTIRDSSFIGQESDMVFIIHRIPDETTRTISEGIRDKRIKIPKDELTFERGYAMLKIEKARRAGTHRKKINFQKRGLWLEAI